jgi:hypothetical protein
MWSTPCVNPGASLHRGVVLDRPHRDALGVRFGIITYSGRTVPRTRRHHRHAGYFAIGGAECQLAASGVDAVHAGRGVAGVSELCRP